MDDLGDGLLVSVTKTAVYLISGNHLSWTSATDMQYLLYKWEYFCISDLKELRHGFRIFGNLAWIYQDRRM